MFSRRPSLLWCVAILSASALVGSPMTSQEPDGGLQRRLQSDAGLYYLSVGRRIKVEGTEFIDDQLVAKEIELIEGGRGYEIEGQISRIDEAHRSFVVGPFSVRVVHGTRLSNNSRETITFSELFEGLRVKVKSDSIQDQELKAGIVRAYPGSTDKDLEIEGPIESLDREGSAFSLLSTEAQVTPKTRFTNLTFVPEATDLPGSRPIRRDDDEPDKGPIRIGNVYLGGRVGTSYAAEHNFNLNDDELDLGRRLTPQATLEISMPVGESSELYSKLRIFHSINLTDNPADDRSANFDVREAFFYWGDFLHPSLGLQIGRQRFRDRREWVYDDQLDAIRLHYTHNRLRAEIAGAKGLFGPTRSRSDQYYFIGTLEYVFPRNRYLKGYFIKRNDLTSRDEDPIWLGLSSRGRMTRNMRYWAELARMMGRRRDRLLRGWGYDLGASYSFDWRWKPTFALSYAFASGDNDFDDGIDGNFRQTRLNDNTYRIVGLKRYHYYGVLMEPELFNLRVGTFDFGIRPSKSWSVNFAYHNYRQTVPSRELGDSDLDIRPTGLDPRLGEGLDVIFGYRTGQPGRMAGRNSDVGSRRFH